MNPNNEAASSTNEDENSPTATMETSPKGTSSPSTLFDKQQLYVQFAMYYQL